MSSMKPSELWEMSLDERTRGVLQSESSSKGRAKVKAKEKPKCSTSQGLYSLYQNRGGPLSEEEIEGLVSTNVKSPAGAGKKGNTSKATSKRTTQTKGKSTCKGNKLDKGKGKSRQPSTSPTCKSKEKSSGKGKQSKEPVLANARVKKQERFHIWRAQQRASLCMWGRSVSHQCVRHIRCFEELVAQAGISCMWSCHHFGIPDLRSVCIK